MAAYMPDSSEKIARQSSRKVIRMMFPGPLDLSLQFLLCVELKYKIIFSTEYQASKAKNKLHTENVEARETDYDLMHNSFRSNTASKG